jgi:hypothetical protein
VTARTSAQHGEIRAILNAYLDGQPSDSLGHYLMEKSNLPGPRMNLSLVDAFADEVGEAATRPRVNIGRLEALVDSWAALPLASAPVNHPREILPAAATLAYGQVAVSRPDWWEDESRKLRRQASDPRWRTREMVAAALQRMLEADWGRTCAALVSWASEGEPLVARAAASAVAEPRLLASAAHAEDALAVQAEAINRFINIPAGERQSADVRALRQALGFTLSVVTAASPQTGFHLMEELAALPDADVVWIVRENMKHKRLSQWQDRLDTLEIALFRPEQADDEQ